jgi:hypothetical protein
LQFDGALLLLWGARALERSTDRTFHPCRIFAFATREPRGLALDEKKGQLITGPLQF